MSVHALRLRSLIKEGRTRQTTLYFDEPIEEEEKPDIAGRAGSRRGGSR